MARTAIGLDHGPAGSNAKSVPLNPAPGQEIGPEPRINWHSVGHMWLARSESYSFIVPFRRRCFRYSLDHGGATPVMRA
jgi:hypothetical protein